MTRAATRYAVNSPVQPGSGPARHGVGDLRADAKSVEDVELQLPAREKLDDPPQQCQPRRLGQIHRQAFGDHQHRTVCGHSRQPVELGQRRGNQPVRRSGRVEPLPQRDDVTEVDVVPLDARAGMHPQRPGVQAAAEVKDRRLVVHGKKLPHPPVEVRCTDRRRRRIPRVHPGLRPVVVELRHQLLGVDVPKDRARQVGVERPRVERRKHGLRCAREVDAIFLLSIAHDAIGRINPTVPLWISSSPRASGPKIAPPPGSNPPRARVSSPARERPCRGRALPPHASASAIGV
ncbi:MAG: hypothetical protein QOH60_3578 [Mycobacterium sp.]|nr:hypothetical protein [Mycobacterium sp.]